MMKEILMKQFLAFGLILIVTRVFNHHLKKQWRLLGFLPFFIFSFVVKPITIQSSSNLREIPVVGEFVQLNQFSSFIKTPILTTNEILKYIWLLGIVIFTCIYFLNYWRFTLKNDWQLLEEGKVSLVVSQCIPSAFSIGIIKKRIVVPSSFLQLSNHDQTMILEHERKHFHYHHQEILLLMNIIKIIYWFNPMVYAVSQLLKEQMEYCVDDSVNENKSTIDKKYYCECLLKMSTQTSFGNLSFSNNKSKVVQRIKNVMTGGNMKTMNKLFLVMIVFGLTACGSVSAMEVNKKSTSSYQGPSDEVKADNDYLSAKEWLMQEASKYQVNHETDEEPCYHSRGLFVSDKGNQIEFFSMPHGDNMYYIVRFEENGQKSMIYLPFDAEIISDLKEEMSRYHLNKENY